MADNSNSIKLLQGFWLKDTYTKDKNTWVVININSTLEEKKLELSLNVINTPAILL